MGVNQLFAEINPQQEAAVSGGHGSFHQGHNRHQHKNVYRIAIPKDGDLVTNVTFNPGNGSQNSSKYPGFKYAG